MNIERMRALVNTNYLRVEMDINHDKQVIISPRTDIDPKTIEEIGANKPEIMKYIRDIEKGKDRIRSIIHHLKLMEKRKNEIPFDCDPNNPYEKLDLNKIEDLNKAIEIAKTINDEAYLFYFIAKKILMEDDNPSPQEIERAKMYNTITEMCFDYAKTFDDFGFCDIGAKYRERIILMPDENLDTIKEDFDKEITLFCESKDYDLNFSHLCNLL